MKQQQGANLQVKEMSEWQSAVVENVYLSPGDRLLAGRLTSGESGRLGIDELKSGVRITAGSWVGVVRFEQFEVRVIPKLAGENLGLVKLFDYAGNLGILRKSGGDHSLPGGGTSLLDLLALLFAGACENLLRSGLLAGYIEREGDLAAVRGRLLVDRQVLRRYGRVDRVECRYDEQETDILENRLLATALSVTARRIINNEVRARLRRLLAFFDGICQVENLNVEEARALLIYHRLNENYREAHGLAWLLLEGFGIEDMHRSGDTGCFAFLLDMNRLFERFVCRWVGQLLQRVSVKVLYQAVQRSIIWDATASRPYARVIPDLLLQWGNQTVQRLAVDAKYKIYDESRLSPSDVYQLFLYAYAFGNGVHEKNPPFSLLLYPSTSPGRPFVELHIKNMLGVTGARIRAFGMHIPTALDEADSGFTGPVSQGLRTALSDF